MKRRATPLAITLICYIAFVSLGAPDAVLGVAFPDIRMEFGLPSAGIGFILVSSSTGYFLSSTFAGTILRYVSLGTLLALSTSLVAIGLLGYAVVPFFPWFMLLAFGIGSGSGAIDTGLNAYATAHFSAAKMNWLHGFFGIGAMLGPLAMTGVLASGRSWQSGYTVVGGFILAMAVIFILTRNLWEDPSGGPEGQPAAVTLTEALRQRPVLIQIAVFLVYCGIEVTVGQWGYSILRERFGASQAMAGVWVSLYWGSIAVGRLILGPLVDRVGATLLVRVALLATIAGAVLFLLPVYGVAVAGVLLIGFGLSSVFPTLITLTSRRLPAPMLTHAIGFSVAAAVVGGATFPTVAGLLEDHLGVVAIAWLIAIASVVVFLLNDLLNRASSAPVRMRQMPARIATDLAD